jgi:hypothetical protein
MMQPIIFSQTLSTSYKQYHLLEISNMSAQKHYDMGWPTTNPTSTYPSPPSGPTTLKNVNVSLGKNSFPGLFVAWNNALCMVN